MAKVVWPLGGALSEQPGPEVILIYVLSGQLITELPCNFEVVAEGSREAI
jgi:hypothetical protein